MLSLALLWPLRPRSAATVDGVNLVLGADAARARRVPHALAVTFGYAVAMLVSNFHK